MKYTTGRVIDLVSNDVQRVEDTKWLFVLFKASIELIVVTALLYYRVGWQALMGVIFLFFSLTILWSAVFCCRFIALAHCCCVGPSNIYDERDLVWNPRY